jgi:hypothetical protein
MTYVTDANYTWRFIRNRLPQATLQVRNGGPDDYAGHEKVGHSGRHSSNAVSGAGESIQHHARSSVRRVLPLHLRLPSIRAGARNAVRAHGWDCIRPGDIQAVTRPRVKVCYWRECRQRQPPAGWLRSMTGTLAASLPNASPLPDRDGKPQPTHREWQSPRRIQSRKR